MRPENFPIQGTIDASATLAKASISVSLYHPRDPDIHRNNCRGLTNTHLRQVTPRGFVGGATFLWLEYLSIAWSIWVCVCYMFAKQNIKGKCRYTLIIPMHWASGFKKETCIYIPCFWPHKTRCDIPLKQAKTIGKTHLDGLGRMIFANLQGFLALSRTRTPLQTPSSSSWWRQPSFEIQSILIYLAVQNRVPVWVYIGFVDVMWFIQNTLGAQ